VATYVTLFNWTDQGAHDVQDTVKRVREATALFESMGVKVLSIHWTQGQYDLVGTVEAPDDQTLAAAVLRLGSGRNVRTKTLRAFNEQEMLAVLERAV